MERELEMAALPCFAGDVDAQQAAHLAQTLRFVLENRFGTRRVPTNEIGGRCCFLVVHGDPAGAALRVVPSSLEIKAVRTGLNEFRIRTSLSRTEAWLHICSGTALVTSLEVRCVCEKTAANHVLDPNDLATLNGVGSALLEQLHACGVHTFHDLVEKRPKDLREEMRRQFRSQKKPSLQRLYKLRAEARGVLAQESGGCAPQQQPQQPQPAPLPSAAPPSAWSAVSPSNVCLQRRLSMSEHPDTPSSELPRERSLSPLALCPVAGLEKHHKPSDAVEEGLEGLGFARSAGRPVPVGQGDMQPPVDSVLEDGDVDSFFN